MMDPERVGHEAAHLMTFSESERDEMREACGVDLLVFLCNGGTVEDLKRTALAAAEPECDDYPGEDMDGDHASALASCGWGTDEDYGCFGGDDC
jgi:hypothetical protein